MTPFFSKPFPRGPRSTVAQRLEWLLAGRSVGGWAKGIGMVGASIDGLRGPDARPPSHEFLTRIMRTENASLSWLLGADAPPFLVNNVADRMELIESLQMHLQEEDWQLTALQTARFTAWVLNQPAAIATSRGDIEYTAVQIIAGPTLDVAQLRKALPPHSRAADTFTTYPVTTHLYSEVAAGHVGTWRMFHAEAPIIGHQYSGGLADYALGTAPPGRQRVAESIPAHAFGTPQTLAEAWDALSDRRREALSMVIAGILSLPPEKPD